MNPIIWICIRCLAEQSGNPLQCWRCGYTVYRPKRSDRD